MIVRIPISSRRSTKAGKTLYGSSSSKPILHFTVTGILTTFIILERHFSTKSRSLIKQSESAIQFWQSALENGFDSLLESASNVEKGGPSSIRRRSADLPLAVKDQQGGEEE